MLFVVVQAGVRRKRVTVEWEEKGTTVDEEYNSDDDDGSDNDHDGNDDHDSNDNDADGNGDSDVMGFVQYQMMKNQI